MACHANCLLDLYHCFRAEKKEKKIRLSIDFQNRHFLEVIVVKTNTSICTIQTLRGQTVCITCSPGFGGGLNILLFTISQWFSKCGSCTCSISITREPIRNAGSHEPIQFHFRFLWLLTRYQQISSLKQHNTHYFTALEFRILKWVSLG